MPSCRSEHCYTLPFFLYLLTQESIVAGPEAWIALLVSGIANSVGIFAYIKAIKIGELSEVIPLIKLEPVSVAVLAPLILSEPISPQLTGSLLLVASGSYIVMLRKAKGLFYPFKNLKQNKALQIAMVPPLMWGFAAIADRFGNQRIDPKIYLFFLFLTVSFNLGIYIYARDRQKLLEVKQVATRKPFQYILMGVITILAYISVFTAFSMAKASQVVPVLQTQTLLTVIIGGYLFSEENLVRKLIGSLLLILGIILVTTGKLIPF